LHHRKTPKEKARVFFSEEKKQKTFILALAAKSGTWPERAAQAIG